MMNGLSNYYPRLPQSPHTLLKMLFNAPFKAARTFRAEVLIENWLLPPSRFCVEQSFKDGSQYIKLQYLDTF